MIEIKELEDIYGEYKDDSAVGAIMHLILYKVHRITGKNDFILNRTELHHLMAIIRSTDNHESLCISLNNEIKKIVSNSTS